MDEQVSRVRFEHGTSFALTILVLAILSVGPVYADASTSIGNDTLVLQTEPTTVSSGDSTLVLTLTSANAPKVNVPLRVKLTSAKRIYFESTLVTDSQGTVQMRYFFDTPGEYVLTVKEEDGAVATLPVHVRGQALLLIGFLTAVAIALGILLDKRAAASVF